MINKDTMDGKFKHRHRGINRAEVHDEIQKLLFENEVRNSDKDGVCVFISHRSTDKKEATTIANYIKDCGIDVYIDVDDEGLQIATIKEDPQEIVDFIHRGILQSTHILVLISDDTRKSWWVPYEIGYGEKSCKQIATMMLEQAEVDSFPDYLKIVKRIFSISDFLDYIKRLKRCQSRYGGVFEGNHPILLPDESEVSRCIKKSNWISIV